MEDDGIFYYNGNKVNYNNIIWDKIKSEDKLILTNNKNITITAEKVGKLKYDVSNEENRKYVYNLISNEFESRYFNNGIDFIPLEDKYIHLKDTMYYTIFLGIKDTSYIRIYMFINSKNNKFTLFKVSYDDSFSYEDENELMEIFKTIEF